MVLEIYLFIDPLNRHCYDAEKTIDNISRKLNTKVSVRFISMLNIKILNQMAAKAGDQFDRKLPYNIVLDSKAASFQGKKLGRHFLMDLQRELLLNDRNYNDELVYGLAENNGLDCRMFEEDRRSSLAENMFKCDQRMVHEMSVDEPATAVLFNSAVDNNGVLINDFDYNSMFKFCAQSIKSVHHFEELIKQHQNNQGATILYPQSNFF
ncbi:DsbA family protein [Lentilactobacillus hilgardii]|uniref:Dithiol-disulfide isomerase n=1 Tax=Lentilactobacillus hilgardii (strain ATCC 8290 / DSM 20176 / CCUG 30140 / JCM 1155 / KCTC 3500 / NBRC 15886 / NCIMB 8040 / NRRL B-1843 / 9) TaxID=1423757 RepID=C0XKH9_LENH9|nr:DsbA family protein [Lentilactobacillus hilgardii]EEI24082.1 hypothetical protein HMPREF0519_1740 [Lentilactobacillus hilgardii DSM 20176 = ATCC 8290]